MSHYATYVLVPNDTVDVTEKVEDLLLLHCQKPNAFEYVETAMRMLDPVLNEKFGTETAEKEEARRSLKEQIYRIAGRDPFRDTEKTDRSDNNNPAKLDWWEFGGRWSGMLSEATEEPVNDESAVSVAGLEMAKVPIPFAIITPDGAWHAQGEMGLGGRVADVDKNWEEKARALLADHNDAVLVVVDCHI